MRWSIAISQFTGPQGVDHAAVQGHLRRAEELGFEGAWAIEQSLGPTPLLAPLETLAYAAGCTERLRLGVAVVVASLTDPLHLAASVATLDHLSNGRFELGISAGGGFRNFAAFGIDGSTFIARFNESLRVMKAAWAEESVDVHGRFFTLDNERIGPKPLQQPHPPIWFGAWHPRSIARAVRHGDGFLGAGSTTTEKFAFHATVVREQLEEQGRDPSTYQVAKRVYLAVDDDRTRAREQIESGLVRIYGDSVPGLFDVAVSGTASEVAAGLVEVRDAGAQMILLHPLGASTAEDVEQMERLVADVLPQVD